MSDTIKFPPMSEMYDDNGAAGYVRPNKSQQKRDMQALVTLTKGILALSVNKWAELRLPIEIIEELQFLRDMSQDSAKKRQMKRVAKLLRDVDLAAAREVVAASSKEQVATNAAFHLVESWRDRLLTESGGVLAEFLTQYPGADVQKLNQLIRNAKKELARDGIPKSSRLLFKLLREIIE